MGTDTLKRLYFYLLMTLFLPSACLAQDSVRLKYYFFINLFRGAGQMGGNGCIWDLTPGHVRPGYPSFCNSFSIQGGVPINRYVGFMAEIMHSTFDYDGRGSSAEVLQGDMTFSTFGAYASYGTRIAAIEASAGMGMGNINRPSAFIIGYDSNPSVIESSFLIFIDDNEIHNLYSYSMRLRGCLNLSRRFYLSAQWSYTQIAHIRDTSDALDTRIAYAYEKGSNSSTYDLRLRLFSGGIGFRF